MNIYRITRKNLRVYDDYTSITVRARSSEEARATAVEFVERSQEELSAEQFNASIWADPKRTDVELIELSDEPQVLATQFRHG